jgi:hypothetical protein
MRPLSSSFTEAIHDILHRLNVELLYQKSLCVLHRNFLRNSNASTPDPSCSRKTCTDASLQILKCQAEVHLASQAGGKLNQDRWKLSSLTLHDFLLAAMITALDLYEFHTKSANPTYAELDAQIKK